MDTKRGDIIKGKFIPTKENVLREKIQLSGYKNLNVQVGRWIQKNTPLSSLMDLKRHFRGKSFTEKLYEFLDSKKDDILTGKFTPSKENIILERKEFENFDEINNRIAKWLKKNTSFSGIRELLRYFKGKPIYQKINEFLDSKRDEILTGKFIPDSKSLNRLRSDLTIIPHSHTIVYNWIKENTPFESLSDLKEHFEGKPLSRQLWEFLDYKKDEILTGRFIPKKESITAERSEFKDYDASYNIVCEWLKENTSFESIAEIREYFYGIPLPDQIRNFLDSKKNEILKGEYFPTKANLREEKVDFGEYSHTNDIINNWLRDNSEFDNITELKELFNPSPYSLRPTNIRDKIKKVLDSRKEEIFSGELFPSVKNFRQINSELGNYKYLNRTVSDWLSVNSNSRFKNLEDLIEHFDPLPSSIGHKGHHGYTANFESEKYRVKNAINQTVRLIDDNDLSTLDSKLKKYFKRWKSFFNFLDKNKIWEFVDLLSGEIITKDDYLREQYAFHHIDGDKQNDDDDNLVFLLPHNHGIITLAQLYYPQLAEFFEELLKNNIFSLKDGEIPLSWRTNWRVIAIEKGIKLPTDKYKSKKVNKSILNLKDYQKDISKWFYA